jgi:hypothetical protein
MLRITALLLTVSTLAGCVAMQPMPMQTASDKLDAGKSTYLMSITLDNTCRDRFVPNVRTVQVVPGGMDSKEKPLFFQMDSAGLHEYEDKNKRPRYLVRLQLDPGAYTIRGTDGMARGFPIIGTFFTPLHFQVKAGQPGVYYLGSVHANVRERKGEEFRAGPPIPLIDQGVACASTGTFDVNVTDDFEADMALFNKAFTQLNGIRVQKAVVPPFDRAAAQKWWEQN